MSYYLSEAYEELYNPRVDSNFDDNLRFIDFMQDHEIEEVVESVFWELRDYGNSLEEAIETLQFAVSEDVICEAYDDINLENLDEAAVLNPYAPAGSKDAARYRKYTSASKKSADQKMRMDARLARVKGAVKRRVDGAISRVKSGIAGARGGMGRATKALGGTISKAGQEGKARLGQLLRRGVKNVGKFVGSAGKAVQKAGERSSTSGLASRKAGRMGSGGQMELVFEPTTREKTGGKMSALGKGVRKAGAAIRQMGRTKSSGMSRTDYDQRKAARGNAARSSVGNAFDGSSSASAGRPMTPRRQEALEKLQKAAEGKTARGVRFVAPTGQASATRSHTDIRGRAGKFAAKAAALREYEEILDSILDALIEENYASDYDTALHIFTNLSENVISEIAEDFLLG